MRDGFTNFINCEVRACPEFIVDGVNHLVAARAQATEIILEHLRVAGGRADEGHALGGGIDVNQVANDARLSGVGDEHEWIFEINLGSDRDGLLDLRFEGDFRIEGFFDD